MFAPSTLAATLVAADGARHHKKHHAVPWRMWPAQRTHRRRQIRVAQTTFVTFSIQQDHRYIAQPRPSDSRVQDSLFINTRTVIFPLYTRLQHTKAAGVVNRRRRKNKTIS
jgi:hypothetical protein